MPRIIFCLTILLLNSATIAAEPNRKEILERVQRVMGPMPLNSRKVALDMQVVQEEPLDGYIRRKVTFAVEAGDRVPAWLLIPTGEIKKKLPAMLCLHQTIPIGKDEPVGLGEQESKRQALHLVKRGYVCLAPDYPSFGEYRYDFATAFQRGDYASGSMKAIWNNMRAIDLLESLPEVDRSRIGAIGHSLGGHNALFTAAFDPRIQVTATSCGFCSFSKYMGGNLKGWTSDRYMPRIAREFGNDPRKMPFDFTDVFLAICPRAIFVSAPLHDANFDVEGVRAVIRAVQPEFARQGAVGRLKVVYPDAKHDWPTESRNQAYEFIDSVLKKPVN